MLAAAGAIALGALGAVAWHRLGPERAHTAPEPTPVARPAADPRPGAATSAELPATPALGSDLPADGPRAVGEAAEEPALVPGSATSPPAAAKGATDPRRFELQAITRRDGRPVAILNDRLVREGDSFDGVRVVRIGELEVELETASGRLVVGF